MPTRRSPFGSLLVELARDKSFWRRIGRLLSHPVSLLAVATVFAALAGAWLTNYYQERAWIRQQQFTMFQEGAQAAWMLVNELSEMMSRRFFGLNRVVWVAKGTGTGALDEAWEAYYASVEEWNARLMSYRMRAGGLIGPEAAQALGGWGDPVAPEPQTIHGQFYRAHELARALVDCVRQRCPAEERQVSLTQSEQALNRLGRSIEGFIQACMSEITGEVAR
jgi:hypothetical protein